MDIPLPQKAPPNFKFDPVTLLKVSKKMAWLLRHGFTGHPDSPTMRTDAVMDSGGFVSFDALAHLLWDQNKRHLHNTTFTYYYMIEACQSDEKNRFEIVGPILDQPHTFPNFHHHEQEVFHNPVDDEDIVCYLGRAGGIPDPAGQPGVDPAFAAEVKRRKQLKVARVTAIRCVQGTSFKFLNDDRFMFEVDPECLPTMVHMTKLRALTGILATGLQPGGTSEDHDRT